MNLWGGDTALYLPFYCPEFESQAQHLRFHQFIFESYHVEKTKINKKEARIDPFLKGLSSFKDFVYQQYFSEKNRLHSTKINEAGINW